MGSLYFKFKSSSLFSLFAFSIKMVFSNPIYIAIAGAVTIVFWIIFNLLDNLLFFSPVVTFYLADDAIASFIISNFTAIFLGIVVAMNVYLFKHNPRTKLKATLSSFFSSSSLSIASSACASCSSLGFSLISTFGAAGVFASTIISNYQIPIKLTSLGLLVWATYTVSKRLTGSCIILNKNTTSTDIINNNDNNI